MQNPVEGDLTVHVQYQMADEIIFCKCMYCTRGLQYLSCVCVCVQCHVCIAMAKIITIMIVSGWGGENSYSYSCSEQRNHFSG